MTRQLMGEDVLDQPLLPQPGNIWADVLPPTEQGPPPAMPATSRPRHRPVVTAASNAELHRPAVKAMAKAAPPTIRPTATPATARAAPTPMPRLAVQLAAADTAQRAEAEWRRLRHHAPRLTDGHQPAVTEAEVNGREVWRLRATGFADIARASAFCSGMRAVKADCWVVPPSGSP